MSEESNVEGVNYFAYGSNMSQERMRERTGTVPKSQKAILKGFQLVFNKKSEQGSTVFANIKTSENSVVEGVLYQITKEALLRLDYREGYIEGRSAGNHYQRIELPIFTPDAPNQPQMAWVYIATREENKEWLVDDLNPGLFPTHKYLRYLQQGKEFLSSGYYNKLTQTQTRN